MQNKRFCFNGFSVRTGLLVPLLASRVLSLEQTHLQITTPAVPVQEHTLSTELTLVLAKTDVGCVMEESGFPIIRKGRGFDSKYACPAGFYAFVPKSDTHCALSEDWAGYLCRTGGKVLLYVLVYCRIYTAIFFH